MNWKRNITCGLTGLLVAACGSGADTGLTAELNAPSNNNSHISLSSSLKLDLGNRKLGDRILVEEIQINLADVRLLGVHPSLPAEGLALIREAQRHSLDPGASDALQFPFPDRFQFDDDLALYVRLEPSDELEGASVVIRARLYRDPISSGNALTAGTNSDGEDDDEKAGDERQGATGPDGEPDDERQGATGPDGEPDFDCDMCQRRELVGMPPTPFVEFELRDFEPMDVVNSLAATRLDVVLGISGDKWLNDAAVERLERTLDQVMEAEFESRIPSFPGRVIIVSGTDVRDLQSGLPKDLGSVDRGILESDLKSFEQIRVRRW